MIRATWDTDARSIHHDGTNYSVHGAHPGPAPAHDVEIWLGAYKPTMLALTGAKGDGWLPSVGYVELDRIPDGNAAIDEAALAARRAPEQIRRLLNLNGRFGSGAGFLEGAPRDWAEQLAGLTLATGMSTYILFVASAEDLRRFAEEVVPAVWELVASERGKPAASAPGEAEPPAAAAASHARGREPLPPRLRRSDEALAPDIDRLEEEHVQIHELLERVDRALVALVAGEANGIGGVDAAMALLTDVLLSHFSYEERELIEPLARLGIS